jgi:hypothetical protein
VLVAVPCRGRLIIVDDDGLGDFNKNGLVNFPDYAIFADNWLWQE